MAKKSFIVAIIFFLVWFIYEGPINKPKTDRYLNVSDTLGSINVYFNSGIDKSFSSSKENYANGWVNLEDVLLQRIKKSTKTIDAALYELNLPKIVDALIEKSSQGVQVRLIVDAKNPDDEHYAHRYKLFRLYIEKLMRGKDKKLGTSDDVAVFSDGVMDVVEDPILRDSILHTDIEAMDFNYSEFKIGKKTKSCKVLVWGEFNEKKECFYSGTEQMHNKFLIIDSEIVWTGSWNLTVTGLYGSDENMKNGIVGGNIQHSIEIFDYNVANDFTNNFNIMWGSSDKTPSIMNSKFHSRKYIPPVTYKVGDAVVELFFPPGIDFLDRMNDIVQNEYNKSLYFSIFAWSYQPVVNSIKEKVDVENGLELKGVFDDSYWNMWWSASYDMQGKVGKSSENNPSVPWSKIPNIIPDRTAVKMHAKTMIIDADSDSDPTVITGSANWSDNSALKNDENVLIIHSTKIANKFVQSFTFSYNFSKKLE